MATGKQVSLTTEGGQVKAVWESGAPIPVAGLNLGDFKTQGTKTPQGFSVDAYADTGLPDMYAPLTEMSDTLGTLCPRSALKSEVSQGSVAIQIYSDFFGKLPYDHVALTEQTACNYGQSWPMLVYLPRSADSGTRPYSTSWDLDPADNYWKVVTPHEVAHQWWGNLVGFKSYRDQWMSEGFAQFSAGIFLLNTSPNMDAYRGFWKELQKNLLEKKYRWGAAHRRRRTDHGRAGVELEDRRRQLRDADLQQRSLRVAHAGDALLDAEGKEDAFRHSMQAFVAEYAGKAATTEDWKTRWRRPCPNSWTCAATASWTGSSTSTSMAPNFLTTP